MLAERGLFQSFLLKMPPGAVRRATQARCADRWIVHLLGFVFVAVGLMGFYGRSIDRFAFFPLLYFAGAFIAYACTSVGPCCEQAAHMGPFLVRLGWYCLVLLCVGGLAGGVWLMLLGMDALA